MVETIPPLLGAGVRFLLADGTGLVTVATLAGAALVVGSAARMRPVRAPRPFRDGSGAQR
jgi:hypothetical protein